MSFSEDNAAHLCVGVQVEDEEMQWMMWYSGSEHPASPLDAVSPAAGSIGKPTTDANFLQLNAPVFSPSVILPFHMRRDILKHLIGLV